MNKSLMHRGISLLLTLVLGLSCLPFGVLAEENDGLCTHHPTHTTDCGFEDKGICGHICSNDNGCITVACVHTHVETCFSTDGKLNCSHACTSNEACYTPITNCLHTQHGSCGHNDGKDCDFAVNGCPECEKEGKLIQIKGTDVTIEGYSFLYTGQEIRPAVTVQVGEQVLTENTHYTLTYENNIGVGSASVTVTGLAEGGCEGIVTIPFVIEKAPGTPEFTLVEIKGTDVTIDGTSFPYTGEAIEPAITVTVDGKVLTAGKDYSLSYANNVQPGTGSVTVKGIATASETLGYTGEVTIEFTITPAQEEQPPVETEPEESKPEETKPEETKPEETKPEETKPEETKPEETKPEETKPEETKPEETKPEETKPEETKPEETKPEETKPVVYKITKGDGKTWYQGSGKTLSFTVKADADDFTGISIGGKKIDSKHYTLKDDMTVTLKESYLNKLTVGKYSITFQFTDGEAKGTFRVSDQNDTSNPKTGDSIGTVVAVMLSTLAALGGCVLIYRKHFCK